MSKADREKMIDWTLKLRDIRDEMRDMKHAGKLKPEAEQVLGELIDQVDAAAYRVDDLMQN